MRQTTRAQEVAAKPSFSRQDVRARNTSYVFGPEVTFDRCKKVFGKGDMGAQTRQAIENIRAALAAAGATLDAVASYHVSPNGLTSTETTKLNAIGA